MKSDTSNTMSKFVRQALGLFNRKDPVTTPDPATADAAGPGDGAVQSHHAVQSEAVQRVDAMLRGIGRGWTEAALGRLVTRSARSEAYQGILESDPKELVAFLKDMAGAAPVRIFPEKLSHPERDNLIQAFLDALSQSLVTRRTIFVASSFAPSPASSETSEQSEAASSTDTRRTVALAVIADWRAHMLGWIDTGAFETACGAIKQPGALSDLTSIGSMMVQEQRIVIMAVWVGVIEVVNNALQDVRTF